MNTRSSVVVVGIAVLVVSGCVMGTHRNSPFGYSVTVVPTRDSLPKLRGELLAVSPDSLWVRVNSEITVRSLIAVDHVAVRLHGLDAGKGMFWAALGGVVTGGALTAACASVDGECGAVLPVTLLTWLLVGGVSTESLERSSKTRVPVAGWERLRPYARFPQGLPAGFR
ncbi:MAG TPA: hypothetical protein VGA20_07105 [Gemmatimonadales bacterium]